MACIAKYLTVSFVDDVDKIILVEDVQPARAH